MLNGRSVEHVLKQDVGAFKRLIALSAVQVGLAGHAWDRLPPRMQLTDTPCGAPPPAGPGLCAVCLILELGLKQDVGAFERHGALSAVQVRPSRGSRQTARTPATSRSGLRSRSRSLKIWSQIQIQIQISEPQTQV